MDEASTLGYDAGGRRAILQGGSHVRTVSQQHAHDLQVALLRADQKRSSASRCGCVQVGVGVFEKEADYVGVALLSCDEQRVHPALRNHVDLRPCLHQHLHDLQAPLVSSHHQCRSPIGSLGVHVGVGIQQQLHYLRVALTHRHK